MLRNILARVSAAPLGMKILLAVVALSLLGLMVLLSPLVVVLAVLVLIVALFALLIRALRRRPLSRRWGMIAATSLLFIVVFTGVSSALYGGGGQEQSALREPAKKAKSGMVVEPRTTASPEKTEVEEAEAKPESKPKPESQPDPESDAKDANTDPEPKLEQDERDRFDATATVTEVVDGDTINISLAINGNDEVRLIGMDTPRRKIPARK